MFLKLIYFVFMLSFSVCALAKPLIIAHRGASGYIPEHTLPALAYAYAAGADYIEQDLVLSKDDQLVVLHDIHLDTVSNVAQVFPSRRRSDGRFYAIDFTLAELKQLHLHERTNLKGEAVFKNRYQANTEFKITTFAEQIAFIAQLNRQTGRKVGLYPEIKSPFWHKEQGKDISKAVIKVLRQHNLDKVDAEIYVQCFDFNEVKRLKNELNLKAKLVLLIGENSWQESDTDYDFLRTPAGLKQVAKVTQFIGPRIEHLIDFNSGQITDFAKSAKALNLKIHPYTHRVETLPVNLSQNDMFDVLVYQIEINGLFTDFTDKFFKYLSAQENK
ncbi:glycerophosphodiester phosphodiesterase [Catenovulum sp. 2E275]|uniref:glycerophosphodiester phosphodiesterase n=1 Tax=Catenovulum sp. 2E275 TaxID=2980497 RepID=UPI0021D3BC4D|nr:glycerophosphodiester phosphodiesterase [Catenovulum sp. 2E275]MCU4675025.1 glycerophosphodiester phosphodiesterase [Catenovulum sp. 2E275]